jgi:hypothetical protein
MARVLPIRYVFRVGCVGSAIANGGVGRVNLRSAVPGMYRRFVWNRKAGSAPPPVISLLIEAIVNRAHSKASVTSNTSAFAWPMSASFH